MAITMLTIKIFVLLSMWFLPCFFAFFTEPQLLDDCSTHCRSEHCGAPFLRYGKYCGILYSGCSGEAACDGLDECCKAHDECIGRADYLNVECNENLLKCIDGYIESGEGQFQSNTCDITEVEKTIGFIIAVAIRIGKSIGDPEPSVP